MAFRTKQFLVENFQNTPGLVNFLRAYGAALPKSTRVEKWFQRESIPAEWFAVLLAYLEIDRGGPISLTAYLEGV